MCKLLGVPIKYYSPVNIDYDIYGLQDILVDSGIDMNMIFDESPKVSTIKRLGWYKEDSNELPILCHLSYSTPNLQKGSYIGIYPPEELLSDNPDVGSIRIFKVTRISTIQIYPEAWTCQLAPVIDSTTYEDNSATDNFSYLDIDNMDDIE
jgi:hypothetical protein